MGRNRRDEPDEEDDEDADWDTGDDYDPDDPETYPQGLYDDGGPPNVPCPHCGAEIFEDSERCPRCGRYLSREDTREGKSGAWWVLVVLALAAVVAWITGRG